MYNPNDFSINLRREREKRNMTQEELSAKLKISFANISGWESGRRVPTLKTLCKLCEALDVSMEALCGPSETQNSIPWYTPNYKKTNKRRKADENADRAGAASRSAEEKQPAG